METEVKETHEKCLSAMASKEFTDNIMAYLRIRSPIVYLTTNEETRMLKYFKHLSIARGYRIFVWDCYLGLTDLISGEKEGGASDDFSDIDAVLDKIIEQIQLDENHQQALYANGYKGNIYILLDFHRFMEDADPVLERRLKTIASCESMTTVVLSGPHYVSTESLEDDIAVIDFPYPNLEEIAQSLWSLVETDNVKQKLPKLKNKTKKNEDNILKAANGLTLNEAQSAFSKSLIMHRNFDISTILNEKKQIIRKKGILEFYEPDVSMEDVGGLEHMVKWCERRILAFKPEAKSYGLKSPKGFLMVGLPGCGKSLVAKAIASLYQMPLLRLDFGRLFGSLVGESEQTARKVIKLVEMLAPCILWCDEIEKGIAGAKSSGQTDGGTTSRVVSTFLTWMQEKTSSVFVVCTANDYSQIPPEFMRAGRFDEVFFVDLPSLNERIQIFEVLLKRFGRTMANFDLVKLASISDGYSGAEIEKSIEMSLFEGFNENQREITTKDIRIAINSFKPLSLMRELDFLEMREWAKKYCVLANSTHSSANNKKNNKNNINIDIE